MQGEDAVEKPKWFLSKELKIKGLWFRKRVVSELS
jgi:hypothetical protein